MEKNHTRHALRIAVEITMLVFLLAGGAEAGNTIWDEESGSPLPFTWNQINFDDFNVSGVGTENLTILQTNLGTVTGKTRTIRNWEDAAGAGLVYNTTRHFEEYEISKKENLTVKNALNNIGYTVTSGNYYAKVNLFGEPYVETFYYLLVNTISNSYNTIFFIL